MGNLVISRRVGESVMIGDVEVAVTRIERNQVRISIKAAPEIVIVRTELLEKEDE